MFNYEKLRSDLKEYYMTARSLGFSQKLIDVDLKRVDDASDEALLEIAKEEDIDLTGYEE
ncbi:MAG: hypothetical protein IJR00_09870 [Lachnospiraceae bacterium]|nr:hypothetical protein [Lachnospiraceae bacterium]